MSRKIIGVTVGTSISPEALKNKMGIGSDSGQNPTGGGGGLPLPPAAVVGQYIVVAAVDENGKVTATKAIENPVTDEHINELIDAKLGVIENGTY